MKVLNAKIQGWRWSELRTDHGRVAVQILAPRCACCSCSGEKPDLPTPPAPHSVKIGLYIGCTWLQRCQKGRQWKFCWARDSRESVPICGRYNWTSLSAGSKNTEAQQVFFLFLFSATARLLHLSLRRFKDLHISIMKPFEHSLHLHFTRIFFNAARLLTTDGLIKARHCRPCKAFLSLFFHSYRKLRGHMTGLRQYPM